MGFLDEAIITMASGNGGAGCVSFRREKFIPKGGPDGGDGGNGGSIIIQASSRLHSLIDLSSRKFIRAHNGQPGRGKNQSGKNGENLTVEVPLGTLILDADTDEFLADLIDDNQQVVLLPGGKGGKGNQHFATSTNRVPRIAQPGIPGQKKRIRLVLRFLADIGLIGLPNAGKSTLLARLSTARPKVGDYPFTTIIPNLGIMKLSDERSLTLADIPGLIQGASEGKGLGHRFLKHIERTHLLLHLLDVTYMPYQDIMEDFNIINKEMVAYNPELSLKPQIVLINKMDIYDPSKHRNLNELQQSLTSVGIESLAISAGTGDGIQKLKTLITRKWC